MESYSNFDLQIDWIYVLPKDIWIIILLMLCEKTKNINIKNMRITCKTMKFLCTIDKLWIDYNTHNSPIRIKLNKTTSKHINNKKNRCGIVRGICSKMSHFTNTIKLPIIEFDDNIFCKRVKKTIIRNRFLLESKMVRLYKNKANCIERITKENIKIRNYEKTLEPMEQEIAIFNQIDCNMNKLFVYD